MTEHKPPMSHLSYSRLNAYARCSRQAYFRYEKKIPATFGSGALVLGTAMHSLIQAAVTEGYYPYAIPQLFKTHWQAAVNRDAGLEFDSVDLLKNLDTGNRMCASPHMSPAITDLQDAKIRVTEYFFEFDMDGVDLPIIGYIDMIDAAGIPYDIKTAGRMWSDKDFENDMQSNIYLLGLLANGQIERKFPMPFRFLIITKTKKPRWVLREVLRTEDDLKRTENWIRDMANFIKSGFHMADPRPNWVCNYCDFWDRCKRGLIFP